MKKKNYGNFCTFHLQCGSNKRPYWSIFSYVLYQIWTEQISFFLIYQSHLHECLCRTTGFREAKFTLGLNSYISMHFCEKMNTRVAECTCIYWNWQSYIHLYLVRGWGVVCKPKHFRLYILRCMENLIKIIVNWITFTCTLAIHLWLSYIPVNVRLFGTLHSHLKGFSY